MASSGVVVQSRDIALVLPARGDPYWIRVDGAIGMRRNDLMMWHVIFEGTDLIQTETAGAEVLALDRAILRLAEIIRHHRT
jgi:hypothetical protein